MKYFKDKENSFEFSINSAMQKLSPQQMALNWSSALFAIGIVP